MAMPGPQITGSVITGAKAGFADTASTLNTTLNNSVLFQFSLMFVGASVVISIIVWMLTRHRGHPSLASIDSGGAERKWAESQTMASYLENRSKEQKRGNPSAYDVDLDLRNRVAAIQMTKAEIYKNRV